MMKLQANAALQDTNRKPSVSLIHKSAAAIVDGNLACASDHLILANRLVSGTLADLRSVGRSGGSSWRSQ